MFRRMALDALSQWLARGGKQLGESARSEARRVLDVLIERGDLSRAEAEEIEAGIAAAAETQRRLVEERVLAPLARALRGVAGSGDAEARLAAIEERLARIEALLARRGVDE